MNNSFKGALLSGLVFPGLGQIALKCYKRGVLIIVATLVSLFGLVAKTVQLALAVLEKIQSEGVAIDMTAISEAVNQASTPSGSLFFNLVFLLVILCWVIGVVDAYLIGRRKDIEEKSKQQG
jgi:hypothetical protein